MHPAQYRRYRRAEASEYLKSRWGIDRRPSTLAKLACIGGGPKFEHAGRTPLYPEPELDAWARSLLSPLKASTSDLRETPAIDELLARGGA
jgi:hypothetical protein